MAGPQDEAWRTIGGVALSVVGVCVLLFTLLGVVTGGDVDTPEVAAEAPAPEVTATGPVASESTEPSGVATTTASPSSRNSEVVPSSPSPTPTPTEPTIDPSDVTVQVLDGDGVDDRAPVDELVAGLEAAGYEVVVVNPAARTYDETTVFWSDGRQTAAEEMADAFSLPVVQEAASNLSNSVWVHVVVGADGGLPDQA